MDWSHVFDARRWRRRFLSDDRVVAEQRAAGHAPDATVDEVGAPNAAVGFEGRPLGGMQGNGQGSDRPGGPGWAGWA